MSRLFTALALLLLASSAIADIIKGDAVQSLDVGIICPPDAMDSAPAPDTLAGSTHIITEDPPFVSNARVVPAALGVGFGVKAQSVAPGGITAITMRVSHPPMGDEGRTQQSFLTNMSGQSPSVTFYQFDHSYELVQGTWEMAAFAGDSQLFSVSFEVVDPRRLPELAGACNFVDLLS